MTHCPFKSKFKVSFSTAPLPVSPCCPPNPRRPWWLWFYPVPVQSRAEQILDCGWGRPQRRWIWTAASGLWNSGRPLGPGTSVPRVNPARTVCVCVETRWRFWCKSLVLWRTPPCSRWRRPRPYCGPREEWGHCVKDQYFKPLDLKRALFAVCSTLLVKQTVLVKREEILTLQRLRYLYESIVRGQTSTEGLQVQVSEP